MSELKNFPLKNQLLTTLSDGSLDSNGSFDCVAESIAACLQWLFGKNYEGGVLKEAAYGAAYQGSTDANSYRDYCNSQGAKLSPVECATYENAIQTAHKLLANGIPVIFTEQDDYAPLAFRNLWTHVCTFHADTASTLTAMDPFIAQDITYSDDVWSKRLRSSELWIVEKIGTIQQEVEEVVQPISLTDATVAQYFDAEGDMWKCRQTGKVIGNAILTFYRMYGRDALNGLTYAGLPLTNEIGAVQGTTYQRFERGVLVYDPKHVIDRAPGASDVYLAHIYDGLGIDPRIGVLKQQLTDLNKQLSAKPEPDVQVQAELAQVKARLNQIEELAKI